MSITQTSSAFLVNGGDSVALSSMVGLSTTGTNPLYAIVTAFDLNQYTSDASGDTGNFQGNGNELDFSDQGNNVRGAAIVFTYQTSSKRYYNSNYGYLDALSYTAPDSANDVTDISVFTTTSATWAKASSDKLTALALSSASGVTLAANATVLSEPVVSNGDLPTQATPSSIVQMAQSFVGQSWNAAGDWVLASSIAAESGASLPPITAQSTATGKPGGEWIVAFNGAANLKTAWQALLVPGEMVVYTDANNNSRIATVVSGSGTSAQIVDAGDMIASAHSPTVEFTGVATKSVMIYELDTPIVTAAKSGASLNGGSSVALNTLVRATDPAKKAITKYQVYGSLDSDNFVVGTTTQHAGSSDSAITVSSLASIKLAAGAGVGIEALEVRAFNGTYWGDWTEIDVSIKNPTAPPVVVHAIPNQTWTGGQAVHYTLAGSTFSDPNHETLTYSASLSSGAALPGWLTFDAASETFSGTAPSSATAQTLSLSVTATDTSGLSVKDSFGVSIKAVAPAVTGPVLTHQTASQMWAAGKFIYLQLPADTFSEPGVKLTYTEKQLSGPDVSSWLHFNADGASLTGWVPHLATGTVKIEIIATDPSGHTAFDIFSAAVGLSALGR